MKPADSTEGERDPEGMLRHAAALGAEFLKAWREPASRDPLPAEVPGHVVVAAIGGSATAGDYVAALTAKTASYPVTVLRGGPLPAWVDARTLVLAVSYSGNTAETLRLFDEARDRGCGLVAVASGGQLAQRAERGGIPLLRVSYSAPPRAALGHLLAAILKIVDRIGGTLPDEAVKGAAHAHQELAAVLLAEGEGGPAEMAGWLLGGVPFILAAEHLAPVATRFKNQLAENGKWLAAAAELPEAAHNLVGGISAGAGEHGRLLLLDSPLHPVEVRAQVQRIAQACEAESVPVRVIATGGLSTLADVLEATAWADFASCHVAFQRGLDPTPIPHIERLKIQRIG